MSELLNSIRANAHRVSKPKKEIALLHLEQIIKEVGTASSRVYLESLYSFFDSNRPTKKAETDELAWISQALSKDKTREVLNHLYCDEGTLVATDGRRLHYIENTAYPSGYLTHQGHTKNVDGHYPNYKLVIPESFAFSSHISEESFEWDAVNKECFYSIPDSDKRMNFNSDFVRQALAGMENPVLYWNGETYPAKISDGRRNAIIVPIRK